MVGQLVAAGVAGTVTYLEMDQVFFVPKKSKGRLGIWLVSAGFVLVNAGLAVGLYAAISSAGGLTDLEPWVRGLIVGASYLGLVRLKFATLNDQSFGFEFFYDLAKDFAYVRINRRVKEARQAAAEKLANEKSLADLAADANLATTYDSLLSQKEQREAKAWILRVIEDDQTPENEKRLILADFIQSGSRAGHE
jgi:hypothetical protein